MNKRATNVSLQASSGVVEAPVLTAARATVVSPSAAIKEKVFPPQTRKRRSPAPAPATKHFAATSLEELGASNHQAELFYLQKQIQQQTQMVFILEDGSRIQGVVEWYDRNSIKVRGKLRLLIYKTAIKYLYKAGEVGTAPDS